MLSNMCIPSSSARWVEKLVCAMLLFVPVDTILDDYICSLAGFFIEDINVPQ